MRVPKNAVDALLARYRIHTSLAGEPHADLARGVPLRILCLDDSLLGKRIVIASNRERFERACPISEDDARQLVSELREQGVLPNHVQELQMLEHLLVRCSQLFVDEGLRRLRLAPVYIRRNDYRVGGAAMTSASHISAVKRLDPHAHDAGAVFAHRPTVRRKYDPSTKSQT